MLKLALFVFDRTIEPAWLLAALSAAERDRYARFNNRKRGREYLASRWLLRQHLAGQLAAPAESLAIDYPTGAPPHCAAGGFYLGISHSGPACLCVISNTAHTGCDIEHIRSRRGDPRRIAEHYFHPDEARALAGVAPALRRADFHRLWTLKEAGLKTLGRGLAAGLRRPRFILRPALRCIEPPAPGDWSFAATEIGVEIDSARARFALAVAARTSTLAIEFERLTPADDTGRARRARLNTAWQIAIGA
ncbi:4'-phosphopantetheinyl transferase family protein [Salinisphaera sp.]|uniref:4'-phosphopantetheinyl transferase family protein n=1 Tax=Salinisphaera sp. TaxID=1914330 RepID=UPI002D779E84|nr:4'-phosphopantetheinyl transferase superfamily protein [Salinisphaera sp.]HET7313273.1 4'-phosphopantetheinyl transferase superfamily protein [Salinisphaera sp.]